MRLKKLNFVMLGLLLASSPLMAVTKANQSDDPAVFLHTDWLDKNISPSDNFYAYANGGWQKNNPIPPEFSIWSSSSILQEKTRNIVHDIIQEASLKKASKGSIEQKVGDFYYSGMDEDGINHLGLAPIEPILKRIHAISNQRALQALLAELHLMGVDAFFNVAEMTDFKNSKRVIAYAGQGGLGLPNRDYYLKDDAKFKKIRAAYVRHVTKILELSDMSMEEAAGAAQTILRLETLLAKASMSPIEQRDPKNIYHIKTLRELQTLAPSMNWSDYFKAIGLAKLTRLNVAMPDFFKKMSELLQNEPLEAWKVYLRWHFLQEFLPYLSKPFVDENFNMSRVLTGAEKLLPRWKRVVAAENNALGFAIGKLYVEKYFPEASKIEVLNMLKMLKKTLRADIQTLSWMSEKTRKAAIKKLDKMEERVGFPEKWRDYSSLNIDRGPYVLNVMRANQFLSKLAIDKIDKPVDRREWEMTPQTINAYYDPTMNSINLPAAILQSPYFDAKAPAAVNYGGIGFVAAHEMTHGFDDSGAQFDADGNLKNWWTKEDLAKFEAATDCIAKQFSQYKVAGNYAVQGDFVKGEAVADLGGLILAYRAYHASDAYKNAKTIAGFTPDQQFFLSSAHVWAGNVRPEQEQNLVTVDPHPPMIYRVNGSLAHMPQFPAAFGIQDPSVMIAVKRCVIW